MEHGTHIVSASGDGALVGLDNSFSEDFTSTIHSGVLPMKNGRCIANLKEEEKKDSAAAVIHENTALRGVSGGYLPKEIN
jgi:hypothetical protein